MTRVVAQRVRAARVTVDDVTVGSIGAGLALLVGISADDDEATVERVADKVAVLRIFEDAEGKMNRSAAEAGGSMLVVSQFTLYGDVRKGRRPSFVHAAQPQRAEALYRHFVQRLLFHGYGVECGTFGAHMVLSLENDGPVTILIDSDDL